MGNDATLCDGEPGQHTCHANADVKESRIDFILANDRLTPAVKSFRVNKETEYPTHRPIAITVLIKKLVTETNELQKTTNFAKLFEIKVQEEVAGKRVEADKAAEEAGEKKKQIDEGAIMRRNLAELHEHMGTQIDKRKYRLEHATAIKDTTMQWDLIAAATEDATTRFFQLQGTEASNMRGRSKVVFKKRGRKPVRGLKILRSTVTW